MDKMNSNAFNCTGSKLDPASKKKMIYAVTTHPADIEGDEFFLAEERIQMTKRANPVGSIAIPLENNLNNKEVVIEAKVFIDKLGERLAYERTGVRLYEAAIAKADAFKRIDLSQSLTHIKEEESEHMFLVMKAIKNIGADPTEMTPCADISGVIGQGFIQVLADPRTSVAQMLNTLLSVELTDNAAWELLVNLAMKNGQEKIAKSFQKAIRQEEEHLHLIKTLLDAEFKL